METEPAQHSVGTVVAPRGEGGLALESRWTRERTKRWVGLGLAIAGALTLLIVIAVVQSGRAPAWWAGAAVDPAKAADLAERVERGIATELHRGRPDGEPWNVALTAEQANAWLANRLPLWLANRQGKEAAGEAAPVVRARFRDGVIEAGATTASAKGRVAGIRGRPEVGEDGALRIRGVGFCMGRLGVPSAWVVSAAEKSAKDAQAKALFGAVAHGGAVASPAAITLEDGRRVRLTALRVEKDRLVFTCVTERGAARAGK